MDTIETYVRENPKLADIAIFNMWASEESIHLTSLDAVLTALWVIKTLKEDRYGL